MNLKYVFAKFIPTYFSWILLIALAYSCQKEAEEVSPENNPVITPTDGFEGIIADKDFDWNMEKDIIVNIYAKDNNNNPLKNVRFDIYSESPDNGGFLVFSGFTNNSGLLSSSFPTASYRDEFVVITNYIGLPNEISIPLLNNKLEYTFGGQRIKMKSERLDGGDNLNRNITNKNFVYLGTYNSDGVPDYLEPVSDVIPQDMLDDINAALPEREPVPQYHPEYLASGNETSCVIIEAADVWVTFVHEGAGWKNVLGFFTYESGNPPATTNDVGDITIIFPNASFESGGGGLYSGDKVYIGQFPANTVIGWVLIAQGWSNGQVTNGAYSVYSETHLNPESNPDYQQHNAQLFDSEREVVLNGFEDQTRPYGDEDFNDLLFYVTANPITAIEIINLPPLDPGVPDGDGDGIQDPFDDYPTDPDRALNLFYPGENQYGSLVFEDLWPGKGDYDFNDLVLDCNFKQVANASNEIVEIYADYKVRAVGASFRNGFGIELPISSGDVASITGQNISTGIISLNGNGTEAGQNKASVIVFDDVFNTFPYTSTRFINTEPGSSYETPVEINMLISLTNPVPLSTIGSPPYNPFLIINQQRGMEVHLADYLPTSLADAAYFGTSDDDTDPGIDKYYKTSNNLPWCLYIPEEFDYLKETKDITSGHLNMVNWINSGGSSNTDWYLDNPGNRNEQMIYQQP